MRANRKPWLRSKLRSGRQAKVGSKGYGCAHPRPAREADVATHQSHNAPGEGQSQAGTTVQPMACSVRLLKLLEEPVLLVQCNSDPGVADNELQRSAAVGCRFHKYI